MRASGKAETQSHLLLLLVRLLNLPRMNHSSNQQLSLQGGIKICSPNLQQVLKPWRIPPGPCHLHCTSITSQGSPFSPKVHVFLGPSIILLECLAILVFLFQHVPVVRWNVCLLLQVPPTLHIPRFCLLLQVPPTLHIPRFYYYPWFHSGFHWSWPGFSPIPFIPGLDCPLKLCQFLPLLLKLHNLLCPFHHLPVSLLPLLQAPVLFGFLLVHSLPLLLLFHQHLFLHPLFLHSDSLLLLFPQPFLPPLPFQLFFLHSCLHLSINPLLQSVLYLSFSCPIFSFTQR
ncbi:hypothetical protein DPEC_G00357100 [Dallia pectoralis]|uniref:Uncharacterized protein n=1 Tax=Dallia pectoralis TaxID=75939 RepID=A0ACC2EZY1_DALPE|nr:hypothetical protein DPEC_G00357100 [Dallia pectoralis]